MPKFMMTTAFALMMATTAPLAYAQTTGPAPATPLTGHAMTPSDTTASDTFTATGGELRASEIIGSTVYDEQNQDIGSVKDVLLDHGGRVQSVVLDVGAFLGMGGKYVTVSLNDLKTDNNRLTLNKTKDQLQAAPEFHFRTR
jgi:sporulation protein YlmC with PRC-barrel domain